MASLWRFIIRASVVFGFLGGITGVLWFSVSIVSRLDKLETQMQVIATAPSGGSGNPNPIQLACAELARQAAQESPVSRSYTVDLMEKLNCGQK